MSELQHPDEDERNRAFREQLESEEQMVHRLRDWEEGDIVWGWTHEKGNTATGKTFEWTGEDPDDLSLVDLAPGHERARAAYEDACRRATKGTVFLWVARIRKARTGVRGPDPGEPPLKHAYLKDAHVVESEVLSDDA